MDKLHITKEEINHLPIGYYRGDTEIVDELKNVSKAINMINKYHLIGFDTETKPAFKRGTKNPVSLVQLAIPNKVFLFRINNMGLPDDLLKIFTNPKKKLIGLALRDDIKDLQDLKYFLPNGFIELSAITKELGILNAGARGLAGLFLNMRISKSQQTSNWENPKLTEKQIRYAATDAWLCLEIYEHLQAKGYIK